LLRRQQVDRGSLPRCESNTKQVLDSLEMAEQSARAAQEFPRAVAMEKAH